MPGSILGTEVRRVEDRELLLGEGTFVDNLDSAGVAHAVFVRSPFAHAVITGIDTAEAAAAEGVLAVYTADDLGREPLSGFADVNKQAPRSALAVDKVRYVGDPVALVVAETRAQAVDAAELVDIDYDDLPAVVDMEDALADGAPLQFEAMGSNIATFRAAKDRSDVLGGRRARHPGAHGQPAHRHRADRGQRDARAARPTTAWRPGSRPSTPTWPATCSPRPSVSTRSTCGWSHPTSAAPSAARPARARPRRHRPGRAVASAGR